MTTKKHFLMVLASYLLLIVVSCNSDSNNETSQTQAIHGSSKGSYKGYKAINADLRQRIFPEQDIFIFLQASAEALEEVPLTGLLGGFSDIGSGNKFMNGTPNATTVSLWSLVAQNIAKHTAEQCEFADNKHRDVYATYGGREIKVFPQFKNLLSFICPLGLQPDAKMMADLSQTFWFQVIGFEAPYSEFEAFRDYFVRNEDRLSGKDRVEAMMLAILLNPYYLLEQ